MSVDKVIITNLAALKAKYSKFSGVTAAIQALIAADQGRGIKTKLIDISNTAAMTAVSGKPVKSANDVKGAKGAIDAIYLALVPDYLLLLGGPDVIPHQKVKNPVADDGDGPLINSDLPYACNAGYSREVSKFLGPTRVIGRLPDGTGGTDPAPLITLLGNAAKYQATAASNYDAYFSIGADAWKESTELSVSNITGSSTFNISPPKQSPWSAKQLKPRLHFFNCHGGPLDQHFYGQPDGKKEFPIALDATDVQKGITRGTVVAAECCFGAELYDAGVNQISVSISETYLRQGAHGYFGSTSTAYGPATGNGEADLITQNFLIHVLSGASLGRAALQARQDFILKTSVVGPMNLKTLAQFYLLGDPSIHPVQSATTSHATVVGAKAFTLTSSAKGVADTTGSASRSIRRDALAKMGLAIASASNFVKAIGTVRTSVRSAIDRFLVAALEGVTLQGIQQFKVVAGNTGKKGLAKGMKIAATETAEFVHLAIGKIACTKSAEGTPHDQYVAVEARRT